MTKILISILSLLSVIASGIFISKKYGKYKERAKGLELELEEAAKDAKIRSRPRERGDALLKSMRDRLRKQSKP